MNYLKIYNTLMDCGQRRRTTNQLIEKHHIVPKCLGGTDDKSNISALTPREHFIAHRLLCKLYPTHKGLMYALWRMCRSYHQIRCVPSRTYEHARLLFSHNNPNKGLDRKLRFKQKRDNGEYKYDYKKVSATLKNTLSGFTIDQMRARVAPMHQCDQAKRRDAIRIAKASTLQLTKTNGNVVVFTTCDDVRSITGYSYDMIKYLIRKRGGVLTNGLGVVKYLSKYKTKEKNNTK